MLGLARQPHLLLVPGLESIRTKEPSYLRNHETRRLSYHHLAGSRSQKSRSETRSEQFVARFCHPHRFGTADKGLVEEVERGQEVKDHVRLELPLLALP